MSCERTSLVEADFDGRLWPGEKASLERHLRGCATCREHQDELVLLRETLHATTKPITPMHHRRARLALLRAAAAPERKRRPTWLLVFAIIVVPVAVWAGASSVRKPRLLETKDVTSHEARSFEPPPVAPRIVEAVETPVAASSISPRPPPPAANTVSPASLAFNAAMEAIARGDFGAGASQLERFAALYPNDPRVEEALYLDAIALERAGRVTDAKAAARRYLAAYPQGAHRLRAAKLVDENIPKGVEPTGQ